MINIESAFNRSILQKLFYDDTAGPYKIYDPKILKIESKIYNKHHHPSSNLHSNTTGSRHLQRRNSYFLPFFNNISVHKIQGT